MRSFGTSSRLGNTSCDAGSRCAGSRGAVRRSLRVLGWTLALGGAGLLNGAVFSPQVVMAQNSVNITFPQSGQTVRGAFKLLFDGVPDGGYAMVYLDLATTSNKLDAFKGAITGNSYEINTFPLTDGQHTVTVVGFNSNGRRIGQSEVTFNVANTEVDTSAESVRLLNWTLQDRLATETTRFKVFAESSADITGGTAGGAGGAPSGGAPGGMGGAGGSGTVSYTPAPLDWQVDLLIRREVRDVRMVDGSANVKLNVKEAFHRQREGSSGQSGAGGAGGAAPKKRSGPPALPGKGPWMDWVAAPETGQYFVKMVMAGGREINATRKSPTIPLGDLTPEFPDTPVKPGQSWESEMVLVTELSQREPIKVRGGMYFTAFENLQTPGGKLRRCARLESQFDLPESVAMRIAKTLQKAGGTSGQGAAGGGPVGSLPSAPGGEEAEGPEIAVARTNVRRIVWFDIAGRRLMRAEDYVNTYYEEELQQQPGAPGGSPSFGPPGGFPGGFPGAPGGAPAAPAEPTKVNYRLKVLKYLDDTLPSPTNTYNAGAGTAHSRDNVQDPPLSRVTGR